jgi:AcrR family transcriptional regulator
MKMEKPTAKRKEREREARRDAILAAAARVFLRKGYYEATLDEIAAEAEMAKGTIYNYYKDKQDLFISLAKHGYEHFEEVMSEAKVQHTNLADFLHYLIRKALEGVSEHVDLAHMLQSVASQLPEELRNQIMTIWHEHVTLATRMLADSLAEVAETKNLSSEERMAGAKLIAGAFLYLTHISCACVGIANSADDDVNDFVRLISRALTVEHAS